MSRRLLAVAFALAAIALVPAAARADDDSTVTVVGTSDVSDSNLVQAVLKPGFEAAFPQYHLSYVSLGTGAAINYAKAGTASALLVHAASLENQFVRDGFSEEQYGRAIFYGDYVLLGPPSDPAHVLTEAPHDIVSAVEKIAAAGQAGQANFVSRGGTPGTTVQEHLIWQQSSGVTLCTVSAANGGGSSPSTTTGACPSTVTYPSWYHATGLTQGPNIDNADVCNYTNGNCYVLTDRGTFNYLQTQNRAQNLRIVVRDNSAAARGGANFLTNSFHAYVINKDRFAGNGNVRINTAGATAFVNWVTSGAGQAAVKAFLSDGGDSPFLPSSMPALTGTAVPPTVNAGTAVTVTGNLRNVVPGTPSLAGETVSVSTPAGAVGAATADANGNYSITFTPVANASFAVTTGRITKIEDPSLNPVFGDLLTPATTPIGSMTVQSAIKVSRVQTSYRSATVTGTVAPDKHANGVVTISARKGGKGSFVNRGSAKVTGGTYSVKVKLSPGSWQIQARFDDQGQVVSSVASTVRASVPGSSSVKTSKVGQSGGTVSVRGSVSPAPSTSGAYVRLLARPAGKGKYRAHGKKVKIAKGRKAYTVAAKLSGGRRWQVRVEYVHKGKIDTSKSKTRTLRVR